MKPRALRKVTIHTVPQAEEAITELLQQVLGESVFSYTDVESGTTSVSAFLNPRFSWGRAARQQLQQGMEWIRQCGLHPGSIRIRLSSVRPQDWARSWRRHFQPIPVGKNLFIKPSWSRRRPLAGQVAIVLDPGLSFGTGHHPTTFFCLRQLLYLRRPNKSQSLLDLGTGSGILAISAAKLGFQPIDALDFDPDALRTAQANASQNRVSSRICFRSADVSRLPLRSAQKYSVICANLLADLLMRECRRILNRLAPGGHVILAGILKREFNLVRRVYEQAGFSLIADRTEDEWRSGTFHAS